MFVWKSAPLSFKGSSFDITGGVLSWNPETSQWRTIFPTMYGEFSMSGTYTESGILTLIEDSSGGFGKHDIPAIQAAFDELLAGWERTMLSFRGSMFHITGGTLSWNPKTSQWTAVYPTMYGETVLAGTYAENGALTLVEDSSGGFAKDDLPAIQSEFDKALAGWKSAPLSFQGDMINVTGGTLSWNPETMEWSAVYLTAYGEIKLLGTIAADGTLSLVRDNSGGYAIHDLPAIQSVFSDALAGKYQASKNVEIIPELDQHEQDILEKYDAETRKGEIVFYGASNFRLWNEMENDLAEYKVQNHGFGGSTDKDLVERAEKLLYPYEPSIVFFQTGSNDYVNLDGTDDEKIVVCMEYKKEMFETFHAVLPDAKFVVMSGLLLPGRSQYTALTQKINTALKEYCAKHDYMWFIDAENMTFDGNNYRRDLFREDMIHMNHAGQLLWCNDYIRPMLQKLVAENNH